MTNVTIRGSVAAEGLSLIDDEIERLEAAYVPHPSRESRSRRATVPVTLDDVRELALSLPRSYEAVVRGRVKFRVGQIVYVAFSLDGETMGFGFPKELRDALVQSEPHKFSWPSQSDMRFNWVQVRLAAIDAEEMRDLVEGAWAMCVPKRLAAEYAASQGYPVEC